MSFLLTMPPFRRPWPRRRVESCSIAAHLCLILVTSVSFSCSQSSASSQLKTYELRREFRGPNPGEGSPITADPHYMQVVGTVGVSTGFSFSGQNDFRRGGSSSNREPALPKVIDFIADSNPSRGPGPVPGASPEIIHGKWMGPNRGPAAPAAGHHEQSPFMSKPGSTSPAPATGHHERSSFMTNAGNLSPATATSPVVQVEFASPELVEGPWFRTPTVPTPEPLESHDQESGVPPAQLNLVRKSAEIVEGPWIVAGAREKLPASPEWDEGPWIVPTADSHLPFVNASLTSEENLFHNLQHGKNYSGSTGNIVEIQSLFSTGEQGAEFYDSNDNLRLGIQGTDLLGNQYFIEQPISTEDPTSLSYDESTKSLHPSVFSQIRHDNVSSVIGFTDVTSILVTEKSDGVDDIHDSQNFYTTEDTESNNSQAVPSAELTKKPVLVIKDNEETETSSQYYERINSSQTSFTYNFKSSEILADEMMTTQNPSFSHLFESKDEPNIALNSVNSSAEALPGIIQQPDVDQYDAEPRHGEILQISLENEEHSNISGDYSSFDDSSATSFVANGEFHKEVNEAFSNEFFPLSDNLRITHAPQLSIETLYEEMNSSSKDITSEVLPVTTHDLVNEENTLNINHSSDATAISPPKIDEGVTTSQNQPPMLSTSPNVNSNNNLYKYDSVVSSESSFDNPPAAKKVVAFKHPTAISVVQGPSFAAPEEDRVEPAVAEARTPSKLPERLPYDEPHFIAPGSTNSRENLHSLEDLYGRDTHKVQYFVGEKAKEMKRLDMNASETLMPPPALPLPILSSYEQFISNEKNNTKTEVIVPAVSGPNPVIGGPPYQTLTRNSENNNDDVSLLSVLGYFGKLDDSQNRVKQYSPTEMNEDSVHQSGSSVQVVPNDSNENRVHDSMNRVPFSPTETRSSLSDGASTVLFKPIETTHNRFHGSGSTDLLSPAGTSGNHMSIHSLDSKRLGADYNDAVPSVVSNPTGTWKNIMNDGSSDVQISVADTNASPMPPQATSISGFQHVKAGYSEGASRADLNPLETKNNRVQYDVSNIQFIPFETKEGNVRNDILDVEVSPTETEENLVHDGAPSVLFSPTDPLKNRVHGGAPNVQVSPFETKESLVRDDGRNVQLSHPEAKENRVHEGALSVLFNPTGTKANLADDNAPTVLFSPVKTIADLVQDGANSFQYEPTAVNAKHAHKILVVPPETKEASLNKGTLGVPANPDPMQNSLREDVSTFWVTQDKSEENRVHDGSSTRLIGYAETPENLVQLNDFDQQFFAVHNQQLNSDYGRQNTDVSPHIGSDNRRYEGQNVKYSLSSDATNNPSRFLTPESSNAAIVTELKPVYIHRESGETSRTPTNAENSLISSQNYYPNNPVNEVLFLSDDTYHDENEEHPGSAHVQQNAHAQGQIQSIAQDRKFELQDAQNLLESSTSSSVKYVPIQKYQTHDDTQDRVFAQGHHHQMKVHSIQDAHNFKALPERTNIENSYNVETGFVSGDKVVEQDAGIPMHANEMLPPPALMLPLPHQIPQSSSATEGPVKAADAFRGNILKLPPVSVHYDYPPSRKPSLHVRENSYYIADTLVPPLSPDLLPPQKTLIPESQPMIAEHSKSSFSEIPEEQSAHELPDFRDKEQGSDMGGKLSRPKTEIKISGPFHPTHSLQQQRRPSRYSDRSQSKLQISSIALEREISPNENEFALPTKENNVQISRTTPDRLDQLSGDLSLPPVPAQENSAVPFPTLSNTDEIKKLPRTVIPFPTNSHQLHHSFASSAIEGNPSSHYHAPQQSIYQGPALGQRHFMQSGSPSQNLNFLRPPPPPPPPAYPFQDLAHHVNPIAPGQYWNSHARPSTTANRPPPFVLVPFHSPHTPSYELALRNFSPPPSLLQQFSLLRSTPNRPPPRIQAPPESQTSKASQEETTTSSFAPTSLASAATASKSGSGVEISSEIQSTETPKTSDENTEKPTVIIAVPVHEDSALSESENDFSSVLDNHGQDVSNLNSTRESLELLKFVDSSDLIDAEDENSYEGKSSSSMQEKESVSSVEGPSGKSSLSSEDGYNHRLGSDSKDKFPESGNGSLDLSAGESARRSSLTGAGSPESHAPDTKVTTAPELASSESVGETRKKNSGATRRTEAEYDDEFYDDGREDDGHRDGLEDDVHDLFQGHDHLNRDLRNDIRRLAALAIDVLNDDVQLSPDGYDDRHDEDHQPDLSSGPEAECWAFTDQELIINPGADVFIGVALPLSSSESPTSCGPLQGPWVAALEALKWGLARLNQDRGQVGHRILSNSYVPGLKFGARVVDTCGRATKGRSVMEVFYPQLSGVPHCPPPPALFSAGVINLAAPSAEAIPGLPILDVGPDVAVPLADRARAALQTAAVQGWNRSLLLVEQRSYHLNMAEVITSQSSSYNVCISAVDYLPDSSEDRAPWTYRDLLGRVRRLLRFGGLDGVVVVASGRVLQQTLSAVASAAPHLRADVPWLLTDVPVAESAAVRSIVSAGLTLQLLTTMPPLAEFEQHWRSLPSALTEDTPAGDTFLQYLEQETGCSGPLAVTPDAPHSDCRGFSLADVEADAADVAGLEVVERTRTVVPALHGLFTLARAVHDAWRRKCDGRPGACRSLQALSLQEFYYSFLSGLEFDHLGPGARSPLGLKGGKRADDPTAQLAGSSLSVYRVLDMRGNITTALTQVMLDGGREVLNASSLRPPQRRTPPCFGRHCAACLAHAPQQSGEGSTEARTSAVVEPHVYIPSPQDVYVVGMFAVHETSEDGTGCGPALRAEAIQEVEAMLWAVQQINRHSQLLPSTQLGVVVLDTCGAQVRATNQVTNIIKETLPGLNIGLDNIYAFITSLDLDTAKVVGEMLASLNITSMNLGQSLAHSPFALQMSPPPNLEAEAIVQVLQYLGWDFVSMVVSGGHAPSTIAAAALHTVARAARVCVGLELSLTTASDEELNLQRVTKVVSRLVEFSTQGARAVLLFLEPSDAQLLVGAVNSAQLSGLIDPQQLILISGTGWGDNTDQILAPSSPPGSVLLKDGQQDVQDFSLHYRLLTPENNTRNPWFRDFWVQEFGCDRTMCAGAPTHPPVLPYRPTPPTPRVVQAVFSFGAAFTQLLHHLCPHAAGHMCPGLSKWRRRTVLNEFLRNTEVSRVDKPREFFQFTENFHGNAPLEVVNVQRTPVRSVLALPAIDHSTDSSQQLSYVQVGRYFNGELSMKTPLAEAPSKRLVPLDSLPSSCTASCAATCTHRDTDYIFVESPDKVYIVAALNVHTAGSRPLECGPLRGDQGIQEVESFLWALAQANAASKSRGGAAGELHLPSLQIGAVIFDACSNKEKVVRDVTNLLTGRLQERIRQMLPSSDHIIGVVVGGRGEVPQQVLDITQPYGITSVTTLATHSHLSNTRRFPAVLRLAPSNYLKAAAMASILQRYDWSLFSIVYSDGGEAGDTAKHLLRDASKRQLEAAVTEPIPLQVEDPTHMLEVWGRLAEGAQKGARVVVLLLQSPHLELFLLTGASLRQRELLLQGDFVFLMTESPAPYLRDPSFGLNTLVVQPPAGPVPTFADHFLGLSLLNHTSPYPWFAEFWAQVFGCQGASCLTGPPQTLGAVTRRLRISEGVPPTAAAVELLAGALHSAAHVLCNQSAEAACDPLVSLPQFREEVFRAARGRRGHGLDGQAYAFGEDGRNVEAVLQVLNYREIGPTHIHTLVKVGEFSEESGLILNSSLALSYDSMGDPMPMTDVQSKCSNPPLCGKEAPISEEVKASLEEQVETVQAVRNTSEMNYIQIYGDKRFGISGLVPYHKKGKQFFTCGDYAGEPIFQNLAAVAYALNQINSNSDDNLGLGAIFFDYCDRNERAREQMFSFYSGETADNDPSVSLTPDKIVASLSFDDEAAESVSTILSSNYIPHFSSPVAGVMKGYRKDASIISSVPSRTAELHVYLSILKEFNWKYVSVIFDNNSVGKYLAKTFKKLAKSVHICIGDTFGVHKLVSEEYAQELVEALSVEWKPRVIILLVDDATNIRIILEVAQRMGKGDTFLFLAGRSWGNKADLLNGLDAIGSGALTFSLETYDLPDFRLFLSNMTLDNHDPIPDSWFHDYFQNRFECRLSQAERSVEHFSRECDGSERVHADDIVQDPFVFHTILSVNAIAHGLDSYMRKQCKSVEALHDCNLVQSEVLMEIAQQGKSSLNDSSDSSPYSQGGAYGYQLWNYRDIGGVYSYTSAGKWENGLVSLDFKNIRFKSGDQFIPESQCDEGPCVEVCASQSTVYAALRIPDPLPIDVNFRSVYGITTATLSLVGVITIVVAMVYFMMTFPTAAGTSVLGYMILSGCLFIYASNFAFIFQPTVGTCAVRRSLMGIGYATAFASMLVKVMHTWRLSSSSDEENYISLTRPGVLFLVAVCLSLVQTILSAAWLILYPPAVDLLGNVWRCTPSEHFESDLVISLVYVMILIAATILFCLETWQYEENARETRWILLSSLLCGVVWLVWTIVATKAPVPLRDPAIVIGNLSCATVIVLFLYARKLYLASQLSKDVRDLELRSHFTAASSIYNASLAAQKMGADQTQDDAQQIDHRLRQFDDDEDEDYDEEFKSSGRQFVGEQEVSFKKVTLPPERRSDPTTAGSASTGAPRPALRKSLGLSFAEEIPVDFKFDEYGSSEDDDDDEHDDYMVAASDLMTDEEGSNVSEDEDDDESESRDDRVTQMQNVENRRSGPEIRRVGSRQMLVFLNDGHIGDVSRI